MNGQAEGAPPEKRLTLAQRKKLKHKEREKAKKAERCVIVKLLVLHAARGTLGDRQSGV